MSHLQLRELRLLLRSRFAAEPSEHHVGRSVASVLTTDPQPQAHPPVEREQDLRPLGDLPWLLAEERRLERLDPRLDDLQRQCVELSERAGKAHREGSHPRPRALWPLGGQPHRADLHVLVAQAS